MAGVATLSAPRRSELVEKSTWDEADLGDLPILDRPVVSVGGGIASLSLVHLLRIAGVAAADIGVVTPDNDPIDSFRRLARAGQLDDTSRLRSDSSARIDNAWGFPGYALEESLSRRSPAPMLRVLAEPVAAEVFTPVSGHVYHGAAVEADRLGWSDMLIGGRVTAVRPGRDGGFFSLVEDDGSCCSVIRSRYVHLGLGYPALRLSEELQRYRAQHGDGFSCVNAYESHEHVYRVLARTGGTVVVRGVGITASCIIERLLDLPGVTVLHLARRRSRRAQRDTTGIWDQQPFNFPKAAFGGQLARRIERIDDDQARASLITRQGATTTARRRAWDDRLRAAAADGRYRVLLGSILDLERDPGRGVRIAAGEPGTPALVTTIAADFLLDCTGLKAQAADDPLVASLLRVGLAGTTDLGRLRVDDSFEVREARHSDARLFATGALTFGARLGPVDSFWGLQAAALRICDRLARLGFCDRIGTRTSVRGWWRWLHNRPP